MTYSKKQMMPLIEKFGINPETNQLFINICEMFDGQPNYQLWGVKVIFSKVISFDELENIKQWTDANQQMVQKLQKQNIIPYNTKTLIKQLQREMTNLDKLAFVKTVIETFNTAQRQMLNTYLDTKSLNSMNLVTSSAFTTLHQAFSKFVNLPKERKQNFIRKNSAIRETSTLLAHIQEAIQTSYEWNREDLLAFVKNNTPDCDVIYDNGNDVVILRVKSYKSSSTLCAGGRTNWCITTSDGQWKNYVVNGDNKQFFFFDFSKPEKDELAHIGFTVSDKQGIIHAHSTTDRTLMGAGINYNNQNVNIQKAMKMAKVSYASFMPKKDNKTLKWSIEELAKLVEKNKNHYAIAYADNNRIILNLISNSGLKSLCAHTYIPQMDVEEEKTSVYCLFDFNLEMGHDNSVILIHYRQDEYGTPSLEKMYDTYGADITKDGYLSTLGIKTDDYLNRAEISPDILLHKLIDEHDEEGAIKLIQDNAGTIDINYQFNTRIPVYSAMEHKMFKLMSYIIQNEKFKTTVEDDDFVEPLFTSLLYLYTSDGLIKSKDDEKGFRMMIEAILANQRFDFNDQDLNYDSAVNICCEKPQLDWVAINLIRRPEINVNIINEFGFSALTNAIRNSNKTALTELGKRPDLIVRDVDTETAKELNVNLDDYIKPEPMAGLENIVRKEPKRLEIDFMAMFERALKECR